MTNPTLRPFLGLFVGLAVLGLPMAESAEPRSSSTVGMPAKIDQIVIPGTELEAAPIEDRRTPVVLRIAATYPHGSAFRYDLVYYGLEPGDYDLRSYLRRKDGSPLGDIPPITVTVSPLLAPGQIMPHSPPLEPSPRMGGYRFLIAVGASLWLAGLTYILMRGRRRASLATAASDRPVTLADRLRPLVAEAMAGTLGEEKQAELERLLIGHWRDRLGLGDERPAVAMSAMRAHPEAGPLLRRLEDWLHRPEAERRVRGDELADILRPYLELADEPKADEAATASAGGEAR